MGNRTERWVAIYVRISKDKNGRAENVEIQKDHAIAYAERQWPGVAYRIYCDNDLTAADPDTYRPDYERMLRDVRAGHVAQVVSADQDRLTRQPAEWEALMPVLLAARVTETHGYRDGVTSVEPGKRAPGRFKVAMGAEYVEGLKVKQKEKLDKLADDGRHWGSRHFNYRKVLDEDGDKALELIPERAAVSRWAGDAVLAGHSQAEVCRALEAKGFGHWSHSSLRSMLLAPLNAGFRGHKGDAEYRQGGWEPVFDYNTWVKLHAYLAQDREVIRRDGTVRRLVVRRWPGRRFLLSGGAAFCWYEDCQARLVGRTPPGRKSMYVCPSDRGGCGRIHAVAGEPLPDGEPGVEQTVVARLFEWLQSPEFAERLAEGESAERRQAIVSQLGTYRERRRRANRLWTKGDLDDDDWDDIRGELDGEVAVLNAELAGLIPVEGGEDPAHVVAAWGQKDLAERRRVIDRHIARVVVHPAMPGIRHFDASRVSVKWR